GVRPAVVLDGARPDPALGDQFAVLAVHAARDRQPRLDLDHESLLARLDVFHGRADDVRPRWRTPADADRHVVRTAGDVLHLELASRVGVRAPDLTRALVRRAAGRTRSGRPLDE